AGPPAATNGVVARVPRRPFVVNPHDDSDCAAPVAVSLAELGHGAARSLRVAGWTVDLPLSGRSDRRVPPPGPHRDAVGAFLAPKRGDGRVLRPNTFPGVRAGAGHDGAAVLAGRARAAFSG